MLNADTDAEVRSALAVTLAIVEAIRESKSIPSGHLYAQVLDRLDISSYQRIVEMLKHAGLIAENGAHLLTWVGPELSS